ncbi:MAG: DUF3108 domain-containing protein [Planctomycetota bacterium]|nr:DUF3108 domain-containing protein [Planctomycetota bacterium]
MPSLHAILPLLAAPFLLGLFADDASKDVPVANETPVATAREASLKGAMVEGTAPLSFPLGGGVPDLLIPRGEHLAFGVHVTVGPVGATVGKVFLDTGVDAFQESLVLLGGGGGDDREVGWLKAKAEGGYLFYDMVSVLDSRYLPQDWPSISYYSRQTGSENRRREIQIGLHEGVTHATFRKDSSSGAPRGKRIWQPLAQRDVPEGTMDMLGAVYLARTLLLSGEEQLVFPLIDKMDIWKMTLSLGEERRLEVPAGTFDAVEILLEPSTWEGEPEQEFGKFRGLFGIRGSIHLWVERTTGVPIRIQGTIPAGPVEVECDIYLETHTGTPDAFQPIDLEAEAAAAAKVAVEAGEA